MSADGTRIGATASANLVFLSNNSGATFISQASTGLSTAIWWR